MKEGESIDCTVTSTEEQKKIETRKLIVFPNPVSNKLVTIENPFYTQQKNAVLKIYHQNGQRLKSQVVDNQQKTITLNIQDLIKGAYQIVLETSNLSYSETLIIP